MNSPNEAPASANDTPQPVAETRFDVIVKAPPGCDLGALLRRLIDSRAMFPANAERLVHQLRHQAQVRSSRMVSREQADKALRKLGAAGLEVVVSPAQRPGKLPKSASGTTAEAPQNLLDDDELLSALRGAPYGEATRPESGTSSTDADSRSQSEARWTYGPASAEKRLPGSMLASQGTGMQWARAMVAVAGVAFAAGWWGPQVWRDTLGKDRAAAAAAWDAQAAPSGAKSGENIDKLLTRLDETVSRDLAPAAGATVTSSLKPDVLAKGDKQRPALTEAMRVRWLADFAVSLAEMGQAARADEVLDALAGWRHGRDPDLSAAVRRADLITQAWGLGQPGPESVKVRVETLNSSAASLIEPAERADDLGELAAVLARQPQLPLGLADSFLAQAEAALKVIVDPGRKTAATRRWAVHQGEVWLAEIRREAGAGQLVTAAQWAKQFAKEPVVELSDMDSAHLIVLRGLADRVLAAPVAARQVLADMIAKAEGLVNPVAHAHALRILAPELAPVDRPVWIAAMTRAASRADAATGSVRAAALAELARAWAEAGQTDAQALVTAHALQTPGLDSETASRLGAELLLGGELGQAMAHHRTGEYAQADAGLRSLAAKLL